MKIELKKVQVFERMSQETTCYAAEIYVDGKKAGTAENAGHGGSDNLRFADFELEKKVFTFIRAGQMSVDLFFAQLLDKVLQEKHDKRVAAKRQKFISETRLRGHVPFAAVLSDKSELMFSTASSATDYATAYAAKRKLTVISVEEMR